MPELPEVETVARMLDTDVSGHTISRVIVVDRKLGALKTRICSGRPINRVRRVGKQVVLDLGPANRKPEPVHLVVHLRMTGRLLWMPGRRTEHPRHRLRIHVNGGRILFCDTRRFGTVVLHRRENEFAPAGLDPVSSRFTTRRLHELIGGSGQEIKTWLLRQDRLVGLGNIYASEILFAAGIDPRRKASSLDRAELARVHRATRRILNKAIENCGTTFSDFQDSHGSIGGYARYLKVYGHGDDPCPSCGTPVERIVQQQRSTFYCPGCQG